MRHYRVSAVLLPCCFLCLCALSGPSLPESFVFFQNFRSLEKLEIRIQIRRRSVTICEILPKQKQIPARSNLMYLEKKVLEKSGRLNNCAKQIWTLWSKKNFSDQREGPNRPRSFFSDVARRGEVVSNARSFDCMLNVRSFGCMLFFCTCACCTKSSTFLKFRAPFVVLTI